MKNEKIKGLFSLQWHLTDACMNNCMHCYITENTRSKKNLSIDQLLQVASDFIDSFSELNLMKSVSLTGGDPLLCPHFWEILEFLRRKGGDSLEINILGNPNLLTMQLLHKLEKQKINYFQLSLDGMEKTHDFFRGKGNFKMTLNALRKIAKTDIKPIVQSTVSKLNFSEMCEIADMAIENGAYLWDFARFVPTGENVKTSTFSPSEYKIFLEKMKNHYLKRGYKKQVGRKDPLWILLEPPVNCEKCRDNKFGIVHGGCSIGSLSFSVLPNGKVMACRRHLGSVLGSVPEQRFEDIFFESETLDKLRDLEKIQKCNKCEWLFHCRGCRAVAYGENQNLYSSDPQCWL